MNTINQVAEEAKKQRTKGKKIGLITGCFDVLHFGHLQLFHFAKKHADYVIVGLENNQTISLSKGNNRPINTLKHRLELLSELKSVDGIFVIKQVYCFDDKPRANKIHSKIYQKIQPHFLITATKADRDWRNKKRLAQQSNIKFLPDSRDRNNSSTSIIDKI